MLIWLKALNAIGGSLPCLIKPSWSLLIHSFWSIFKRMIKPGLLRSTLLRAYSKLCDRNESSDGLPSCDPLLSGIHARDWVLQRACYPQHSSRYCLALLRHIITLVTGNRGHLSLSHLLNACICFTLVWRGLNRWGYAEFVPQILFDKRAGELCSYVVSSRLC